MRPFILPYFLSLVVGLVSANELRSSELERLHEDPPALLNKLRQIARWDQAGVEGGIPTISRSVNFLDHVGKPKANDIAPALQNLIERIDEDTVIYFPPGDYYFRSNIRFRPRSHKLVLRGAGADQTTFHFETPGIDWEGLFEIRGEAVSEPVKVLGSAHLGSQRIRLASTESLSVGDTVVLSQDNDPQIMKTYHTRKAFPEEYEETLESWAKRTTGQILKIESIEGDFVELDRPLRMTYEWNNRSVQKLRVVEWVGLENFRVINHANVDRLFSIKFTRAANCWVSGVVSEKTVKFHVSTPQSRKLTIRDSHFFGGFRMGGGGHGYGVVVERHTSDCLVVNNSFSHLRHALMAKEGANGNVFAANVTREGRMRGTRFTKDVSIHGHYPFMNLFEQNSVEYIHCADWWGPAGPYNVFFRNHVRRVGIRLEDYSPRQVVVANLIQPTGEGKAVCFQGDVEDINHIAVHRLTKEAIIFHNVSPLDASLPTSLYR